MESQFLHRCPEIVNAISHFPFLPATVTFEIGLPIFELCKTANGAFEERGKTRESWESLLTVHAVWFAAYRFDKYGWSQLPPLSCPLEERVKEYQYACWGDTLQPSDTEV